MAGQEVQRSHEEAEMRTSTKQAEDTSWKTVATRKPATKQKMRLLETDWSVPPREDLCYNEDGVYLAATQDEAELWAKQLGHPAGAVGILTLKPLAQARAAQMVTFRALATDAAGRVRERALSGYLCQLGQERVHHHERVLHVSTAVAPGDMSLRLTVKSRENAVTSAQPKGPRRTKNTTRSKFTTRSEFTIAL